MKVSDISVGNSNFDDVILRTGDYFGERALATDEPRAATVTALTEGVAFSIDRMTFEKVLGKFSRLIIKAQDRRLLVRRKMDKMIWSFIAFVSHFGGNSYFCFVGGNEFFQRGAPRT
jgi:CRP-like cAMP-binding protein